MAFSILFVPAVAGADEGWYLITPQELTQSDGTKIIKPSPLSQWLQYRAFDSAPECELFKSQLPEMIRNNIAIREKKEIEARRAGNLQQEAFNKGVKDYWTHSMEWFAESLCISRSDPKLRP
ncbi:MAG: hypothetical protein ACHQYP_02670 [Nitrospiria bacterium]